MNSKAKDEMHLRLSFESHMDNDTRVSLKLATFALNIKSKMFGVLDSFLSFLRTYEKKKGHLTLSLMFDLRFKNLCFVSSYVGKKQGLPIVEEYDKKALYPMLVKSYNHLHLIGDVASSSTKQDANKNYGLNIFQMTNNSIETAKEIIPRELLDFRRFHVDVKDIINVLQWWEQHESRFHAASFLAQQILRIVSSQIETKHIFSLAEILTSFKRCWLQSENLDKLFFVSQNWPNDPRVGCNMPSTLVEFIKKDEIVEESKEFEGEFEREEIADMNFLL
jgi:hypothetical protein